MLSNKHNQGFTLIELMIALVVFTIGLTAALSLAMSNYNNSRDNLDKIIAANLAREGIELIRNVRDSNWLRSDANDSCGGVCTWDYALNSLTGSNNGYIYIDFDDIVPSAVNVVCNTNISDCASSCTNCSLYKNDEGYYINDDEEEGFTLTKYSRVMFLKKICVAETEADPHTEETYMTMGSDCEIGDTYIGVNVTSYVQWEDNGTKNMEIVDNLYNWRN